MKKIDDFINNGFVGNLPIYYNKICVINYNQKKNQFVPCKRTILNKYKINGFIANKSYKHLTKISNKYEY